MDFVESPFQYDVEDLFDGEKFERNLISVREEVPKEILSAIAPDFAIRFEVVPVAFDSSGTSLYFVTTEENFQPINLFTTNEVQYFLSNLLRCNCRFLVTDKQNIQAALNKYYNFSEENLRRAWMKFYNFERLTFNSFEEIVAWSKKNDSKVLKKSLVAPPVSDSVESVLKFVPVNLAVKFSLIPVQLDNGVLLLVTSSSRTLDEVKTISKMLEMPCKIFLTLDENIRDALEKFYHLEGLNEKLAKRTDLDFLADGTFVDYNTLDRNFTAELVQTVPLDLAFKFSIVPLDFDCDGNLVLVTSALDSVQAKDKISALLHFNCKILLTDADNFSDTFESAYRLYKIFPEPEGNWANLRWNFLLAHLPVFLLDLQKSGDYDSYFEKFQSDSIDKLNLMVSRQLQLENISADDVGLVENVRAQCREILAANISAL